MADLLSPVASSTSSNHNLDNLPDLVYSHLFKYLDVDEVLELRLVNKKLYSIVKSYDIIKLYFLSDIYFEIGHVHSKGNWYSTTDPIKYREHLNTSKLGLLVNPSKNLLNLKRLKIVYRVMNSSFLPLKFEDINKFTKLEILEIEKLNLSSSNNLLQLPDLQTLCIIFDETVENNKVVIHTPKLLSLCIYDRRNKSNLIDNLVKFTNPLSVKHLEIGTYEDNISVFSNLESLKIVDYSNLKMDDLSKFKNLKKFKISNFDDKEVVELKKFLRTKRDDLDLVLDGVIVRDAERFEEYYDCKVIEFHAFNYEDLDDDIDCEGMLFSYGRLTGILPKIPVDLIRKYCGARNMIVGSVEENGDQLLDFIKRLPNLSSIEFHHSFEQSFYDRLPAVCLLDSLDLNVYPEKLNFEFIMKMPYLKYLKDTNGDVLRDKNVNFNDLNRLKQVTIHYGTNIVKEGKDRYKIERRFSDSPENKFFTFSEIAPYFEKK